MSKPRGTCRKIKDSVATLETGRKQRFCCNKVSYVNKKLKSNTGRILQHISLCYDSRKNRRHNLCQDIKSPVMTLIIATWKILLRYYMKKLCGDKVMNVTTLEDKVSSPDREIKLRQVMLT